MLRQELLFKCLFVACYFVIGLLAFRIYVAVEMFEHKRYYPLKKEEIKKLQIIGVLPKDINQILKKTLLFNFDKLEIIVEAIINSIFYIILIWLFVFIPKNIKWFTNISDFFYYLSLIMISFVWAFIIRYLLNKTIINKFMKLYQKQLFK
ncbi:MAG: hypothetical protein QS2022_3530 [Candidatus Phytoplasma asteris]|nr:MAG: hypothetical protein PLY_3520 [Periwinkle leaf yellowing phytoplasma]WEX19605.1 MAG: hypothetical protein QS2022_3530 [Candidatus Phytoplasma asteris]